MFNSKMYKKYYPIKSSFDIANMNVAEQKKLIYWIKSLSEDIRLHNTNSLKKAMHYIIESFIIIIILGILVGTGLMLCCMAASTDREKDDAEQLKWIHQLSEEKKK